MNVLIGRPESSILRIAGAQMAHFYGIPSHTIAPDTDSNLEDEQNAIEKTLSTAAAMLGANDLIVNSGMFGTGLTASLTQLVIDNELCKLMKRFKRGMAVNRESIGLDAIYRVQPKGTYIMDDHTLDHLRSNEHVESDLIVGLGYDNWLLAGAVGLNERASQIAQSILKEGTHSKLDQRRAEKLDRVLNAYDDQLQGRV